ncbi:MAG: Membrane protein [Anaerolineae bacterium]|nr:MAG: Membrane protein [Anaerolineae bacterium]
MRNAKFLGLFFLVIAAGLKTILLITDRFPFNADEAIVALMARHILLNGERPVFFYGQAYMGSLDAFLVAIGFAFFGFHVWVIRAIQIVLYLLVILFTVRLTSLIFSPSNGKWYTAALLAVPTVNVTLYTTVSLGGYGEALLIGNLILYDGLKLLRVLEKEGFLPLRRIGSLGFWIGLGFWVNGLTAIYALPVLLSLLWAGFQNRRVVDQKRTGIAIGIFCLAWLLGSLPWWYYAIQEGMDRLISELFGSAIATSEGNVLQQAIRNLLNLLIFGSTVLFGLRPPWEIRWLALPLAPFALAIWLALLGWWTREVIGNRARLQPWVITGIAITFSLAFVFTPFGADPSGRYFLPLWIVLSLIAGEMTVRYIPKVRYQICLIGVLVVFNLWGMIECAIRTPPGLTTQFDPVAVIDHRPMPDLIQFLRERGETRGYTNYWVAYPLAFLSEEQIIFSPRLPYHPDLRYTSRDDRYPAYTQQVIKSERVAYITTKNPELDKILTQRFEAANIAWQETWIGDYHVFYRLSKAIHPQQIGLGEMSP